jgi:hypothetical protein
MANLGFYQVQNMAELAIRLNETNDVKVIEKNIMRVSFTIRILVIIGFVSMIILASYFMVVLTQLYRYCYFDTAGQQVCTSQFSSMTFKGFMVMMGGISGFFYSLLTILLIVSFYYLNRALKKRFQSEEMNQLSRAINTLFLVLVISFTLRTFFLFGEGHYETFVK